MNKPLILSSLLAGLGLAAPALQAQETGRVISSVPMIQQVAVPRQVCGSQPVLVEQPRSGASALMGAIAGGGLGNAIGDGGGRAAATLLGVVGGAMLGDRIEGPSAQWQQQTQCATQTFYENRAVGYNVTYEYAGKQYSVQLPYDPGPTIALQLVPAGVPAAPQQFSAPPSPGSVAPMPLEPQAAPLPAPVPGTGTVILREVVTVPAPVMVQQPAYTYAPGYGYYPAPYYRPYYGPRVSLNLGYVRHSGGRHWH